MGWARIQSYDYSNGAAKTESELSGDKYLFLTSDIYISRLRKKKSILTLSNEREWKFSFLYVMRRYKERGGYPELRSMSERAARP